MSSSILSLCMKMEAISVWIAFFSFISWSRLSSSARYWSASWLYLAIICSRVDANEPSLLLLVTREVCAPDFCDDRFRALSRRFDNPDFVMIPGFESRRDTSGFGGVDDELARWTLGELRNGLSGLLDIFVLVQIYIRIFSVNWAILSVNHAWKINVLFLMKELISLFVKNVRNSLHDRRLNGVFSTSSPKKKIE